MLAERLVSDGAILVFTGLGRLDHERIESVTSNLPRCINACDRLSLRGFVEAVRGADMTCLTEIEMDQVYKAGNQALAVKHRH